MLANEANTNSSTKSSRFFRSSRLLSDESSSDIWVNKNVPPDVLAALDVTLAPTGGWPPLLAEVTLVHKCEPMVIGWEVLTPPMLLLVTTIPPFAPPGIPAAAAAAAAAVEGAADGWSLPTLDTPAKEWYWWRPRCRCRSSWSCIWSCWSCWEELEEEEDAERLTPDNCDSSSAIGSPEETSDSRTVAWTGWWWTFAVRRALALPERKTPMSPG